MPKEDIRSIRLRADLTQRQFARALGVCQSYVHQIEAGVRPVSDEVAGRVLELDVELFPDDPDVADAVSRAREVPAPRGPYKKNDA